MPKFYLSLCSSILFTLSLQAQCPPPGFPNSGNTCAEAPLLCQDLDGYCNTINNINNPQQTFLGCGDQWVLNNDEWFAFVAGDTSISIQVTPSNCTNIGTQQGLQAGIYPKCNGGGISMALQCACSTDPFVLSSNNYIVGQVYWFVLDGCAGDVCDYSIQVLSGSTVPMLPDTPGAISGDTAVCGGTTSSYEVPLVNGATQYVWTLSPPGTGIITQGTGNHIDVKWTDTGGEAELCLRTGNACVSNSESVCQTIHVAPKPSAFMGSGGNICLGLDSTFELSITLTGAGPWAFTPLLDGVPQPPIVTSDHPYSYSVSQPGKYTISELYETQQLCPGTTFGSAVVTIDTIKSFTFEFCPGESVTVFGHTYTQPGIIRDTLFEPATCSTVIDLHFVHLPQPTRTKTITFCPGDTIFINGQSYTQPGTVYETIPATTGCDTLVVYTLQALTSAPSTVSIQCPQNLSITTNPGTVPVPVKYALPTYTSDCLCPGVNLTLTSGLPSGSIFPVGLTKVCYTAKDSCGQTASCCFEVTVPDLEAEPCDVKENGCIRYELLSIAADPERNLTYRIRVVNNCSNKLIYTAIQLPDGIVANAPQHLSVYNSDAGHTYEVRNPNNAPFHSIRFKSIDDGIANGQSDIFEYTLPAQTAPDYIHILSKLAPQLYVEAHLNTFYCPIGMTQSRSDNSQPPGVARLFPNPTTGQFWLDLSDWKEAALQYRIFNSQGLVLVHMREPASQQQLFLELPPAAPKGLYFLEIIGVEGRKETLRFVLE